MSKDETQKKRKREEDNVYKHMCVAVWYCFFVIFVECLLLSIFTELLFQTCMRVLMFGNVHRHTHIVSVIFRCAGYFV